MGIKVDLSKLKQMRWSDYAIRFVFGGLVTMLTGVLAYRYGPSIGGLFMAFPAVLPASITLIEKHENIDAAGADTAGAALGSIGLITFAIAVWYFVDRWSASVVLIAATLIWLVVAITLWLVSTAISKSLKPKTDQR
ncbi:DUF3147 family protein [Trichocoleus sp. FACHB-591]|uniref:DUF3147 family protein n=1 Tax=Trichocoleus sp. FACHB-591 TaxID=2692872 RepID=UPI0016877C94|nr:DUF3147 family protein [Trichocoleus sp. FACHB-591]MBD2097947.1 DUF3147 family protein [Trichocoleus sp. FACHB-591]